MSGLAVDANQPKPPLTPLTFVSIPSLISLVFDRYPLGTSMGRSLDLTYSSIDTVMRKSECCTTRLPAKRVPSCPADLRSTALPQRYLVLLCQSQSPPSRAGTRSQWCRALSMMPAESHSARAEGFGRTARAMAALRRRRAIWISCFHLRRRDMLPTNAVRCGMMRCLLHTEASECCPDKGTIVNILLPQFSDVISVMRQFTFARAALRPGTAAVVRLSAGLDRVSVSPLGLVVMPGSESFMPQTTA